MHQELHINGDFWLVVRIDLILLVLESVSKFHKISSRLVSIEESQNNLLSTFSRSFEVIFWSALAKPGVAGRWRPSSDDGGPRPSREPWPKQWVTMVSRLHAVSKFSRIWSQMTLTLSITWFAGCNEPVISCHSTISILDNRFWTWTKSFFKFSYFE